MKKYGIIGSRGKIGTLLAQRPDFVCIECDITKLEHVQDLGKFHTGEFDVIVNCAAIPSIDECEANYQKAIEVNVHGLSNLHRVFGERVLNISTDHLFNGRSWFLPKEDATPSPINNYGLTKFASEGVSSAFGGKTIRLSRTVSINDVDIVSYLVSMNSGFETKVPDFFSRNYIHREFAADGIEYMVRNWDDMPNIVNYAGTENVTMYSFIKLLAMELGFDISTLSKRKHYDDSLAPRPRKGGLNVSLAKSLGFPMYNISNTVSRMVDEYNG